MRTRLLKAKEAAQRLNMSVRTFYQNHEAMGLLPIQLGEQKIIKKLKDGSVVEGATKSQLRWPEHEIERFIERSLQARSKQVVAINRLLRLEKKGA